MDFFPQRPKVTPTIYVYELNGTNAHEGYIKVGYTDRDVETRIREQLHVSGIDFNILYQESSIRPDGTVFTDKEVHKILRRNGFTQYKEGEDRNEWFNCSVEDVMSAIEELKTGIRHTRDRNKKER